MRHIVGILGTPIDNIGMQATLTRLEQFIGEKRFHQVATANTDFLINALADPELRHVLRGCDLVVPDGMPVVWAAKLMRTPLQERVTGADIVPQLARLAGEKGYRIYMLGARPEIAQRARARMEADHPGIQIVGCVSPPVAPLLEMDSETILDDIARARPDILLVAFGNPKQEKWIHLHRERLAEVPLCIGVGGTFDFMAGQTTRAPLWMQTHGLEWAFRLTHEPGRLWKRYSRDGLQFGRYLLWQWWTLRGRGRPTTEIFQAQTGDCTVLSVIGSLDRSALPRFRDAVEEALTAGTHILLDLQGVQSLDAEALGTLINLPKRAAYRGRDVRLVAISSHVATALRHSHLADSLPVAGSIAQAFSNATQAGMITYVRSGADAAVVTANGASEPASVRNLESLCAYLLTAGKRVELDARGLTFADSVLLSALYRLRDIAVHEGAADRLRVIPGPILRATLSREKMTDKFVLGDEPTFPADAGPEELSGARRDAGGVYPSVVPTADMGGALPLSEPANGART